jgi:hypothetical protein
MYGYHMTTKAAQITIRYFYSNPELLKNLFPHGGTGISNYLLESDIALNIGEHANTFPGCLEDFQLDEALYGDIMYDSDAEYDLECPFVVRQNAFSKPTRGSNRG